MSVTGEQPIPEIVAQILAGRGMAAEDMAAFLYPEYERDMADPMLLTDMDKAVERILKAAEDQERVVVYGDYDIDGITASAVLIEGLRELGIEAVSYIPDRFEEGYGINRAALETLQAEGAQLVISVDCGITSVDEAAWAKSNGLDLIITDHHAVPPVIPEAVAVINPKREGDIYPCKELAGVGVAFKLVQALQRVAGRPKLGQEKWLLDLVAMGTICDIVPLVGENRVLVSFGLKVLRRTRRPGLVALAEVGGVNIARITAHEVGFVLGPRMNAAGRLEHAARSVELVMTSDARRAAEIAYELEELNRQRRADQASILQAASVMAAQYADDKVLVLADASWSHGVVGIVASKLVEKYQCPVLLAQVLEDGRVKGSARSVPGFNMVEALRSQAGLLNKFGGHYFAAGYTLAAENVGALRRGMSEYYAQTMPEEMPARETALDLRLVDLERLDMSLLDTLELLEPHGSGNPRPVVGIDGLAVASHRQVGGDRTHLSLKLRDRYGTQMGAIGFGLAERYNDINEGLSVSVSCTLSKNEFQGRASVQMILSEISYE